MKTYFDIIQEEKHRNFVQKVLADALADNKFCFPKMFPKLYKYRSLSNYAVNDIINEQLTLTAIGEFNDMFDGAMHQYGTETEIEKKVEEDWKRLTGYNVLYDYSNDVNFGKEYKENRSEYYRKESKLAFRRLDYLGTYVSCLSSTNDSVLMWSHYADSSRGICIEYDFNNEKLLNKMLFPIAYTNEPLDLNELLSEESQATEYPIDAAVLCTALNKSIHWKYENEWRLVFVLDVLNIKNKRNPVSIKAKKVYFGYHFLKSFFYYNENNSDEKLEAEEALKNTFKLLKYMKDNNIKAYVMIPDIGSFNLCAKEINVEKLITFMCGNFSNNKPEEIRYYYTIHDELMDIVR